MISLISILRCNVLVVVLALAIGCNHHADVPCVEDADCNLSGGGICLVNSGTSHQWCAYPDPVCTSGYRYSNDDVGDGVGGACTMDARYTLTVSVGGNGAGSIVSTPGGLACASGTCTGKFPAGTQVQLTATPTSGSFLGWSNDCHGPGACVVAMNGDHEVGGLFGIPGKALWLDNIGAGVITGEGPSLALDSEGNIIVAGTFQGTIQLGATTLQSIGSSNLFVAKLSSSTGVVVWAKRFGGTGNDWAEAVAVDASNAIYVVGSHVSPAIDFGGGPLSKAGIFNGFLVKLAADGSHVWSRNLGGSDSNSSTLALGVSVNSNGVAVVGHYFGSLVINDIKFTTESRYSSNIFVAKYTVDGVVTWIKSFGSIRNDPGRDVTDSGRGVAIDKSGNVVVIGSFQGTLDLPDGSLDAGSGRAILLLKLASADGASLVAKRFGPMDESSDAHSVAVDPADNIFVAGDFSGSGDFGGSAPLTATHLIDAFLVKYTPVGAHVWGRSFGGTGDNESAVSVSVNAAGDVAITGSFCGTMSLGGSPLTAASPCSSTGGPNSGADMFAARFSGADGSHIASTRGGGARKDQGTGVTLAPDGRMFVSGGFQEFAEFGGTTLTSLGPATSTNGFIVGLPPL